MHDHNEVNKCGERAEWMIPRWGMSWACVLPKGHEGEHCGGGTCVLHGEYVGTKGCALCIADNYVAVNEHILKVRD